ncbi:MAG: divalent cation tolerance protein CutA [Candidatus Kapaibacterium sp.]
MISANNYRIVYVAVSSIDSATHLAKIIVSEHLAAKCNIIPNTISISSWADTIVERHESLLIIKSSAELIDRLINRISEILSEEFPEIISVKFEEASSSYLARLDVVLDTDNDNAN